MPKPTPSTELSGKFNLGTWLIYILIAFNIGVLIAYAAWVTG